MLSGVATLISEDNGSIMGWSHYINTAYTLSSRAGRYNNIKITIFIPISQYDITN